ncbi:MAG: hypothetical protein GXP52_05695 [Deltaproteobacteria bacterium]|nr:hypothetical protein [Deltaproteobacteria bacterium]
MKNSLKGALLSGVVFPGFGQIVLKQYKRGIVLMLTVFAGLTVIVVTAVRQALAILEKIDLAGGVINTKTVTDAAAQVSSSSANLAYNLGLSFIVIFWIYGIVDAYRIGKKMDMENSRPGFNRAGEGDRTAGDSTTRR